MCILIWLVARLRKFHSEWFSATFMFTGEKRGKRVFRHDQKQELHQLYKPLAEAFSRTGWGQTPYATFIMTIPYSISISEKIFIYQAKTKTGFILTISIYRLTLSGYCRQAVEFLFWRHRLSWSWMWHKLETDQHQLLQDKKKKKKMAKDLISTGANLGGVVGVAMTPLWEFRLAGCQWENDG